METSGISKKNKHLTQDERREIEDGLRQGMTFKAIAAGIRILYFSEPVKNFL